MDSVYQLSPQALRGHGRDPPCGGSRLQMHLRLIPGAPGLRGLPSGSSAAQRALGDPTSVCQSVIPCTPTTPLGPSCVSSFSGHSGQAPASPQPPVRRGLPRSTPRGLTAPSSKPTGDGTSGRGIRPVCPKDTAAASRLAPPPTCIAPGAPPHPRVLHPQDSF
ncbi:Hypothetical predicted protein [Pelobates cultripes]|uniref:Uncharacterized protein n=1 Tax=Pelobates cultripes TaxID=61616 RepID=A0AAD1SEZ8_PELCU|nr:Hypothetical predicted protein [Pelobates cultripes]